ncbi:PSD1 and planctomycete cytochrome C domain-containing protein [bacterium]|nr:PSD1 and planctomycete cytochrome C domain-containing protein [bacterium]
MHPTGLRSPGSRHAEPSGQTFKAGFTPILYAPWDCLRTFFVYADGMRRLFECHCSLITWRCVTLLSWIALCLVPTTSLARTPEGVTFFETHVRPVLANSCYECHSDQAGKSKGGLKLDSRQAMLRGGQSGPVLIPGKPEQSLLIQAIRHLDPELKMPPEDPKLTEETIAQLSQWVAMGAPDPRNENEGTSFIRKKADTHWAFQPLNAPLLPAVHDETWIQRPMDRFVLSKLEAKDMHANEETDRHGWIRRVYFTLIGMPPTFQEVEAFLEDTGKNAPEKVVERLLASPHYGERWARHWMDVSRYADTKGYVFQSDRSYPYAYTYRDYLVRAFNEDLPYDRFLKEQLAADLMELGSDKRPLAALGYLTLGRRFLNNPHDIIDDRIDVVSRGMMGLTVTCARCHEHKYDPIPIEDYYSLYGVFASTQEPSEKPLLGGVPHPAHQDYLQEKKQRKEAYDTYLNEARQSALKLLRDRAGEYLQAAHDASLIEDASLKESMARERKLDPTTVIRWVNALVTWEKEAHPVMFPWIRATQQPDLLEPEKRSQWVEWLSDKKRVNPRITAQIIKAQPTSLKSLSQVYGKLFTDISSQWQACLASDPEALGLPDPDAEAIRLILYASNAPARVPLQNLNRLFEVKVGEKVRRLKRRLDGLDAEHPGAPPRAMALFDKANPTTPVVFLRGRPGNHGNKVPRQFLEFLEGPERKPFSQGSGRLELASKIASPRNPLTARVLVNRLWGWHFGVGLVDSASDFGLRCDAPVQQDLMDYLANYLITHAWSIKQLQREIVLSATFRQGNQHRPAYKEKDPENRLLWKFNRYRLDLEGTRDTLLKVTGQLDLRMGGKPVEITRPPWNPRRSVYGYIERQNLPGFFRTFDLASPDSSSPGRFRTSVPQQALYMMNSPFMKQILENIPILHATARDTKAADTITRLYHHMFQRAPTDEELGWGLAFLGETDQDETSVQERKQQWQQFAQTLLMSNELVFVE